MGRRGLKPKPVWSEKVVRGKTYYYRHWRCDNGTRHTESYGSADAPDYQKFADHLKRVEGNGGTWPTNRQNPPIWKLCLLFEGSDTYKKYSRGERHIWTGVFRRLREDGNLLADELDANKFRDQLCRETVVGTGKQMAVRTINSYLQRVKRLYEWAAQKGYLPQSLSDRIAQAKPATGRQGRVTQQVPPVPIEGLRAVFRYCRDSRYKRLRELRDMMRFQLRTGCRNGELLILRGKDISRVDDFWIWKPYKYKTQATGRTRQIMVSARAMAIIRPYLDRVGNDQHIWSYPDAKNYYQAVRNVVLKSGCERWHPYQLRHSFVTNIAYKHGLMAARDLAGHRFSATTEQHYISTRVMDSFRRIASKR